MLLANDAILAGFSRPNAKSPLYFAFTKFSSSSVTFCVLILFISFKNSATALSVLALRIAAEAVNCV